MPKMLHTHVYQHMHRTLMATDREGRACGSMTSVDRSDRPVSPRALQRWEEHPKSQSIIGWQSQNLAKCIIRWGGPFADHPATLHVLHSMSHFCTPIPKFHCSLGPPVVYFFHATPTLAFSNADTILFLSTFSPTFFAHPIRTWVWLCISRTVDTGPISNRVCPTWNEL